MKFGFIKLLLRKDCVMIQNQFENASQSERRISAKGKTMGKCKYMHFIDCPKYESEKLVGYSTCIEYTDDWDSLTPCDQKMQIR